jgi:hypothetical protein
MDLIVFHFFLFEQVAMWNQQSGSSAAGLVVWDYHVFLLVRPRRGCGSGEHPPETKVDLGALGASSGTTAGGEHVYVYDVDSRMKVPCLFSGE